MSGGSQIRLPGTGEVDIAQDDLVGDDGGVYEPSLSKSRRGCGLAAKGFARVQQLHSKLFSAVPKELPRLRKASPAWSRSRGYRRAGAVCATRTGHAAQACRGAMRRR